MVVFLFCIIIVMILITIIMTSCIKVKLIDFRIRTYEDFKEIVSLIIKKEYIKIFDYLDFELSMVFYALKRLPVIKYKISDDKIAKFLKKQVKEHKLQKEEKDIEIFVQKDKKQIDKDIKKLSMEKLQLEANIGTNSPSITAFITTIISVAISIILPFIAKEVKSEKYDYEINPVYLEKNVFNVKATIIISMPLKSLIKLIR